jgi:hypothetical protein
LNVPEIPKGIPSEKAKPIVLIGLDYIIALFNLNEVLFTFLEVCFEKSVGRCVLKLLEFYTLISKRSVSTVV